MLMACLDALRGKGVTKNGGVFWEITQKNLVR